MKWQITLALGLALLSLVPVRSQATQALEITNRTALRRPVDRRLDPFRPTDIVLFDLPDYNDLSIVSKTHATFIGSSRQPLDPKREEYIRESALVTWATAKAHAAGVRYIAAIRSDPTHVREFTSPADWVLDIDGNPVMQFMLPADRPWVSLLSPTRKQQVIDLGKAAVDDGVDIVSIDTWTTNFDVASIPRFNGDFSANSIKAFREYLRSRYSPEELSAARVGDPATFDYGQFIRQGYLEQYKTGDRLAIPFFADFLDFQLQASRDYWVDVATQIRAHAAATGKQILITVNVPEHDNLTYEGTLNGLPIAPWVDGFVSEYPFGDPPDHRTVPFHKLIRSLGKSAVQEGNTGSTAPLYDRPDVTELFKLYTAEAYAAGGFLHVPWADLLAEPDAWKVHNADMFRLYPYYDFIAGGGAAYENLISTARIGLVYSYASQRASRSADDTFFGFANLALEAHYQYDVLMAGDDRWLPDQLALSDLNRYDLIVLPGVTHLSDRQMNLLRDYVQQGGTLLAIGETGTHDELGRPRGPQNLSAGFGPMITIPSEGVAGYLRSRDPDVRSRVADLLRSQVLEDQEIAAGTNLSLLAYDNPEGTRLLHLINYDHEPGALRFKPQADIDLTVRLNPQLLGRTLSVTYVSPDRSGVTDLPFTVSGSSVSFRVPLLDIYGVVAVSEKDRFAAAWQIGQLKRTLAEAPTSAAAGEAAAQLARAEAAYGQAEFGRAATTAGQELTALQRAQADAARDAAGAIITWWSQMGRTYRLAEARAQLAAAADRYRNGDYQGAAMLADEAAAMLPMAMDGQESDWEGIRPVDLTPVVPAAPGKPQIEWVRMTHDRDLLYVAVKVTHGGAEPNLKIMLAAPGAVNRSIGSLWANNYEAALDAGGARTKLTNAVKDGLFELSIPLSLISAESTLALTLSCASGAPDAPPSSLVAGNTVKASYTAQDSLVP